MQKAFTPSERVEIFRIVSQPPGRPMKNNLPREESYSPSADKAARLAGFAWFLTSELLEY
jgi:hypothetical protein